MAGAGIVLMGVRPRCFSTTRLLIGPGRFTSGLIASFPFATIYDNDLRGVVGRVEQEGHFLHGFRRFTEDVDILVTREGLQRLYEALEGSGDRPPFAGSKNLRDTKNGVRIEFLVAGEFPGDGKPKPVAFPEPGLVAVEQEGIRLLNLNALIELKLASGMTGLARLKDLADVQEVIKMLALPEALAEQLAPYVQERYKELWQGAEAARRQRQGDEEQG